MKYTDHLNTLVYHLINTTYAKTRNLTNLRLNFSNAKNAINKLQQKIHEDYPMLTPTESLILLEKTLTTQDFIDSGLNELVIQSLENSQRRFLLDDVDIPKLDGFGISTSDIVKLYNAKVYQLLTINQEEDIAKSKFSPKTIEILNEYLKMYYNSCILEKSDIIELKKAGYTDLRILLASSQSETLKAGLSNLLINKLTTAGFLSNETAENLDFDK